jgi:hypothetical protein
LLKNADGPHQFVLGEVACPNPDCNKVSAFIVRQKISETYTGSGVYIEGDLIDSWNLLPESGAKPMPSYVPAPIVSDYKEACLIRDKSPKASATLSRRCLQGMIRDFWGISKPRLVDEIEAIKDKVDPLTWEAIDAIRSIGNIGAHMEKDINLIVDVDEGEAQELIGLIEMLVNDWYVQRHTRTAQLASIKAIKVAKDAAKKGVIATLP